jgi:DNA-binding NarL/FixJ family response regulator
MSVTVLVVDDVELFRTGLSAALSHEGYVIAGAASDAEEAVTMAGDLQPDLVVLDIMMPGLSGLDVVGKIRAAAPDCAVVMLTASESEEDLLECIRAGARGYLVKDVPFERLARSLHDVASGGAAISPTMAGKLLDVVSQALRHPDFAGTRKPMLTSRELEVLEQVAQGLTSREIGEELYISENTVKNHVRNILDKLGVHTRNEAVLYAVRENLISI